MFSLKKKKSIMWLPLLAGAMGLKTDLKNGVAEQECIYYIDKLPFMVIFLCNLCIWSEYNMVVWIT